MSDPAQDYLDSGGTTAHPLDAANDATAQSSSAPKSVDPAQAYLESGGKTDHPLAKVDKKKDDSPSYWEQYARDEAEANTGASEMLLHGATAGVGALGGGLNFLGTLAATRGDVGAARQVQEDTQRALTYQPRTDAGQRASNVLDTSSQYLGAKEGEAAGDWILDKTGSPFLASAGNTLANVPQFLVPAVAGKVAGKVGFRVGPEATADVTAPREAAPKPVDTAPQAPAAPFDINDPQARQELGIKPEKHEDATKQDTTGNLSDDQQQSRIDLAKRLGFKEVRKSAIEGDAQTAADDFDATKYTDDPMGERMRALIKQERTNLAAHAEGIIDDSGGRSGTDQTTLKAKGKTLAAPIDALSTHLDKATSELYDQVKAEHGDKPVGNLDEVSSLLKDPDFTESLLAKDQGGLLGSIQRQFERFKSMNPDGFSVNNAENFRKFLNKIWTPETSATLGQVKGAVDEGVFKNAGEDVYAKARQLSQVRKQTLDDPDGISKLFDKDPNSKVNRSTAFENIPDKLVDLNSDQFNHIVNVYKNLPPELKPLGDAALGELRGHMANRLLDAGTKTETQWNKKGVNNELSANNENFNTAFGDRPDLQAKIKDLKDAGEMFRFNSSYRGAHAQASNMGKTGVGRAVEGAGTTVGGAVGFQVAGPAGVLPGAAVGKYAVGKGLGKMDAARTRKQVEGRVIPLSD